MFDMENTEGSVKITNRERPEEETEPEEEIQSESEEIIQEEPDGGGDTPVSQTSVKTGDETPIAFYLGVFAAAAVLLLILFSGRKRRNSR